MKIYRYKFLVGLGLAFLFALPNSALSAPGDEKHVLASSAITAASYQGFKNQNIRYPALYSVSLALLAGIAKEASDEKFSGSDMKWNAVGIGLGLLPIAYWEF